ncbi:MAG TPA: glycosyltransferase, partial [Polyangia bacterium]|nr:glycosyltransferase [Polyangia bacterium]
MPRLTVVVPCYNEAERLAAAPLLAFVDSHPDASFLLVNDGSRDATGEVLDRLAAERPGRMVALQLTPNRGKAEAVREGLRAALAAGAEIVGFLDADLSTPPAELDDLLAALARPGVQVAIGARIGMLGYDIERSAARHYLGRVFATAASLILRARVYDTQCGAKLFRAGPA